MNCIKCGKKIMESPKMKKLIDSLYAADNKTDWEWQIRKAYSEPLNIIEPLKGIYINKKL